MTITGLNNYQLEGSEAGQWTFNIVKGKELLTDEIKKGIADFKDSIYWNNSSCKHWIFDYKVADVWIEAKEVNCNTMTMDLILYQ